MPQRLELRPEADRLHPTGVKGGFMQCVPSRVFAVCMVVGCAWATPCSAAAVPETPAGVVGRADRAARVSRLTTLGLIGLGTVLVATGEPQRIPGGYLVGLGVLAGPSAGYFYGGHPGRGACGFGLRFGSLLVFGMSAALASSNVRPAVYPPPEDSGDETPGALAATAAILVLGSAGWDLVTVDDFVRRKAAGRVSMTVRPYRDGGAWGLRAEVGF